jgi:hypothetical protein
MAEKNRKQIMAVSKGNYRGVAIYETPQGFAVALGLLVYVSNALSSITGFIDAWFDLRKN